MPNPYNEDQNRANQTGPYYANNQPPRRDKKPDEPFQFPLWAIILAFVFGWWWLGLLFIGINQLLKSGALSFEQRTTSEEKRSTVIYTNKNGEKKVLYDSQSEPVQEGRFRVVREKESKKTRRRKNKPEAKTENWLIWGGAALALWSMIPVADVVSSMMYGDPWLWLEDLIAALMMTGAGIGLCGWGIKKRSDRRRRRKINSIVGNADFAYIQDIADAIPCSYEQCCTFLEDCIDRGMFGDGAYLDMRTRTLVIKGRAPKPEPAPAPTPKPTAEAEQGNAEYRAILRRLREVNDAIPDVELSDKISRLEAVSAKIFEQAETNPDKLPQMRKFMDYYLPTSLKLLETYAELDAQGIEGENIRESKRRIERSMDTLVVAFEKQLDKLFQSDALDISADLDVMEQMMSADGLTGGDGPFDVQAPRSPELRF